MSTPITNDPILLAALQATESVSPAGTRSRGSSQYRGVSKNKNTRFTTWSAATETGGKSYNLGTYRTEEEAALARNYGDELLRHPKPVKNAIPTDLMPDEITQTKVARTVVMLLRGKGVTLQTPSTKGRRPAEADALDCPPTGHQSEPTAQHEGPQKSSSDDFPETEPEPGTVSETSTMSEYDQKIQRLINNA